MSFAQYGVLTGYGFSATFCAAGLMAGRLADVASRKTLLGLGIAIWNGALVLMAYADSFVLLLSWRLLLGFGQAFSNPASYSLIADLFPEEKRAQANGLFACGVYLGGGLASLSLSMAMAFGWRFTFIIIALVGFGLCLLLTALLKEPSRGEDTTQQKKTKRTFLEALSVIFCSKNKTVPLLFAASSLRFCGGYAIAGYLPTMYDAIFPEFSTQYSYINAYVVAFGGFLSSWLGGVVADSWQKSGEKKARLYLPALGCFLSLPFMAICCLAPNFYISILLGLFFEYLVAECWFGPVVAALQSSLPPDCRALAIACFTLIATLFGSLASYLIGLVYDLALQKGKSPAVIRYILLYSVALSYLSAGLFFLIASLSYQGEQHKKENALSADDDDDVLNNEEKPLLSSHSNHHNNTTTETTEEEGRPSSPATEVI